MTHVSSAGPLRWRGAFAAVLAGAALAASARATTFEPPDFARLVAQADQVVHARVTEVSSYRIQLAGQPMIETAVRLDVRASEKAAPPRTFTLTWLGGRVGEDVIQVDAMPELAAGDEVILFVDGNGRNVCPFVGWGHGVYPVRHDAARGRDYVTRLHGQPLTSLAQVGAPLEPRAGVAAASADAALAPHELLAAVRAEVERQDRVR